MTTVGLDNDDEGIIGGGVPVAGSSIDSDLLREDDWDRLPAMGGDAIVYVVDNG